jgi:hypothetical protein
VTSHRMETMVLGMVAEDLRNYESDVDDGYSVSTI